MPIHSETISALTSDHTIPRDAPRDHVITREMHSLLEKYQHSSSAQQDTFSLNVRCEHFPDNLPGELKRVSRDISSDIPRDQETGDEYLISGLSRDQLLSVIVKLRNCGILSSDGKSEGISLTSSLEKLLEAYDNVRGVTIL